MGGLPFWSDDVVDAMDDPVAISVDWDHSFGGDTVMFAIERKNLTSERWTSEELYYCLDCRRFHMEDSGIGNDHDPGFAVRPGDVQIALNPTGPPTVNV